MNLFILMGLTKCTLKRKNNLCIIINIDQKYAEGLYGYEKICCYGIAFFRKQAKVKLLAGSSS